MTYIADINPNSPTGQDLVLNGDDQIRALKADIKNTLGGLNMTIMEDANTSGNGGTVPLKGTTMSSWEARIKALEALATSPDGTSVPVGGIIIWHGPTNTIPVGWRICDGSTHVYVDGDGNTQSITLPDLRGRFVMGPGWDTINQGDTGGLRYTNDVQVRNTDAAGAHTHTTSTPGFALEPTHLPNHVHAMFTNQDVSISGTDPAKAGFLQYVTNELTNPNGSKAYSMAAANPQSAPTHGVTGGTGSNTPHTHPSTNTGSSGSHSHSFNATQPFAALYYIAYVAG